MKFTQLPVYIQKCIAFRTYDIDSLAELSIEQIHLLEMDNPEELFEKYLEWEGIRGYSMAIHHAHEAIFGATDAYKKALNKIATMNRATYDHDADEMISDAITWAQEALKGVKP